MGLEASVDWAEAFIVKKQVSTIVEIKMVVARIIKFVFFMLLFLRIHTLACNALTSPTSYRRTTGYRMALRHKHGAYFLMASCPYNIGQKISIPSYHSPLFSCD